MITQADWRALTGNARSAWVNFHTRHIANNPTDVYDVMAYGPRKQVNFLAIYNGRVAEYDLPDGPQWPKLPWAYDPYFPVAYDQVWQNYAFGLPTIDAMAEASARGTYLDRKYKPPRCYDTGVSRRRRNIPGCVRLPWPPPP